MARTLELLPVPGSAQVLDLLPILAKMLQGSGPAWLPVPAADEAAATRLGCALRADSKLAEFEDEDSDPTALVIGTSGSTGTPKGALLSVSALKTSAAAMAERLGPADSWLLALPAHHIAGMQVVLRSLLSGAELAVLDTDVPFTAERFVAATKALTGTARFVSLVPTQLRRLLASAPGAAALGTFSAVLVGGAATERALLNQAREAGIRVVTTYGMSETCGGCVYDGTPLGGVEIEAGTAADPRPVSISGPVVARGYRGRPGHPSFRPTGTFHTSDQGFLSDGVLRILGRVDDVIISGGLKIDPAMLEDTMAGLPGIGEVIVTSVPDPEWGQAVVALVVPGKPGHLDPQALRRAVTASHGAAAAPKHVIVVAEIPLLPSGKPDRATAAALAASEAKTLRPQHR